MNLRTPRQSLWHRCLDLLQHICILTAFVLFLSYVQSVTATEAELEYAANAYTQR